MVQFFRKTHKPPLRKNKTTKSTISVGRYFKYGIGEVVKVMIGILLALQVNIWNEDRKINNKEQTFLKDLKSELSSNLDALNIVIDEHQKSFKAAQELLAYSRNPKELNNIPENTANLLVSTMNQNWTYNPKKGILNSIISYGQLTYFKNKELKYLLASIDEVTQDAMEDTYLIEIQQPALLNPAFKNGFIMQNSKMVGYSIKGVFQVPEFWMAVSGLFVNVRKDGLDEEKKLKEMIEKMLTLIENEIK